MNLLQTVMVDEEAFYFTEAVRACDFPVGT
jgi:hypothetical protein